jgi:probable phosphoglycerate mutase
VITRIYLIRHGATVLSAEDRFAGATEVPLSDEGRRQASSLGQRLINKPITAIFASPMGRTIETAHLVAGTHRNLEVQVRDGLREINHGRWEGMTRAEVAMAFPQEVKDWDADPYTFSPEGGESGLSVTARALPVFMEIIRHHPGEHVAVISHKATIRLLLSSLLGFDPRRYRDNLDQSPAALNILDSRGPTLNRLMLFNDISHYESDDVVTPPVATRRLSKDW